jgi:hypothetical protein
MAIACFKVPSEKTKKKTLKTLVRIADIYPEHPKDKAKALNTHPSLDTSASHSRILFP